MLPRLDAVGIEMFNFDTQALKFYEQILDKVELRGGLTLNGVMEADRLFQSPFTDINSQGPIGIFPPARVSTLVNVLGDIRSRAVA